MEITSKKVFRDVLPNWLMWFTALFALLLIVFSAYRINKEYKADHIAEQQTRTEKSARELNHFLFEHISGSVKNLASGQEVIDLVLGKTAQDNPQVLIVLRTAKKLLGEHGVSIAYIMDGNGTVVACTPYGNGKTLTGNNYKFRPYFSRAINGEDTIYAALGVTTLQRGIYLGSPIYESAGKPPSGVAVVKFSTDRIDTVLHDSKNPAVMLSPEGIIFASNKKEWLYHAALPITESRLAELRKSRQFAHEPLAPLPVMLDGNSADLEKTQYTIVSQPLKMTGWQLVTLEKKLTGYPVPAIIGASFIIILGACFFIQSLSYFLQKRILTEKIQKQNEAMKAANKELHQEIMEHEDSERQLQDQYKFLQTIIESLSFPFYVINVEDYSISLANSASGIAAMPNPPQKKCYQIAHRPQALCRGKEHPCPLNEVKRRRTPVIVEHEHYDKDNNLLNVAIHGYPVFNDHDELVQMIEFRLDITEQRKAEKKFMESEQRLKTILDSLQLGIVIIDAATHTIIDANPAAIKMIGLPKDKITGCICHQFICPADKGSCPITDLGQKVDGSERVLLNANNQKIPILKTVVSIILDERNCLLESFIDISELKQAQDELSLYQEQLEQLVKKRTLELSSTNERLGEEIAERRNTEKKLAASLHEKEILLKEVHHRVKNNMQTVSSLLQLQARKIHDEESVKVLKDSHDRIRTMALIHEKIYKSKSIADIRADRFIRDLALNLFESYGTDRGRISLQIDIDCNQTNLNLDKAIPCGLIINELVSNSLKYAFPDEKKGEIKIGFGTTDENNLELVISDNGIGIPDDIDFRTAESLGLHLVTMLAEDQLDGEISLDRTGGTEFKIHFRRTS